MKKRLLNLAWLSVITLICVSCGEKLSDCQPTAEGFTKVQDALVEKFGVDAYYEHIDLSYIFSDYHKPELSITAVVTNEPETKKLNEWSFTGHQNWRNTAHVTLKIDKDDNPLNYLYQLNDTYNLKNIAKMVADAINVLATEAKAEGAMLASATMGTPNDNNVSETQINLRMTSKDRKDTYFFIYSLDGKLISWRNSLDPIED